MQFSADLFTFTKENPYQRTSFFSKWRWSKNYGIVTMLRRKGNWHWSSNKFYGLNAWKEDINTILLVDTENIFGQLNRQSFRQNNIFLRCTNNIFEILLQSSIKAFYVRRSFKSFLKKEQHKLILFPWQLIKDNLSTR